MDKLITLQHIYIYGLGVGILTTFPDFVLSVICPRHFRTRNIGVWEGCGRMSCVVPYAEIYGYFWGRLGYVALFAIRVVTAVLRGRFLEWRLAMEFRVWDICWTRKPPGKLGFGLWAGGRGFLTAWQCCCCGSAVNFRKGIFEIFRNCGFCKIYGDKAVLCYVFR